MDSARMAIALMAISFFLLSSGVPSVQAQGFAPAPAPSSDGASVDQGIACLLMVVALVLTYLIH